MKTKLTRRVLMIGVLLVAVAAPALTYAAYSSRLPGNEAAGAPVALPASTDERDAALALPQEAMMVVAGMALIGAAAVVRRAA
jgi:hypothetical protein